MPTDVRVQNYMTQNPVTIAPTATVEEAVKLMEDQGISGFK